jgi:hypothetical protein
MLDPDTLELADRIAATNGTCRVSRACPTDSLDQTSIESCSIFVIGPERSDFASQVLTGLFKFSFPKLYDAMRCMDLSAANDLFGSHREASLLIMVGSPGL